VTNIGLNLRLQLFSFSNCDIKPNLTHLPKHQILSPNHQFSQRIWYVECCSVHAHMAWNISLDTGDSASNAVVKRCFVFINHAALCRMYVFVQSTSCLRAKIHYLHLWPFAKNLYHGWISTMTSSNSAPPEMKSWLRPWFYLSTKKCYCGFQNVFALACHSKLSAHHILL